MSAASSVARRAAVVAALKGSPAGVSGQALAAELGVSRTAVAKHVAALRTIGYHIDAFPGSGYRLVSAPDALLPFEVAPLLRCAMWDPLVGGGATGSTNDDARVMARAGAPEGAVVLAASQTGGRGRLGRAWASPQGGVYLSVLLRPSCAPADVGPLPLVVGLGVTTGLGSLGVEAGLKWPNDVVVRGGRGVPGGKVAGVLLESLVEGGRLAWVVAGVGLNVRRPAHPVEGAAYIDDVAGTGVGLARVTAAVLDGIALEYGAFAAGGFQGLHVRYAERAVLTGREVRVADAAGNVLAEGVAAGVDDQGRLLVRGCGSVTAISSGDVTLRLPA